MESGRFHWCGSSTPELPTPSFASPRTLDLDFAPRPLCISLSISCKQYTRRGVCGVASHQDIGRAPAIISPLPDCHGEAVDSKCYLGPVYACSLCRSTCAYLLPTSVVSLLPTSHATVLPWRADMEDISATMPPRTCRALDSQQLTFVLRSISPTSNSSDRRDSFFSESRCNRGRAFSHPFTSYQDPLQLPGCYTPKSAFRPALEQLRFGSLEHTSDTTSTHDSFPPEKTTEVQIFSDSDFPPLEQAPSTTSAIVDSSFAKRRVTLPEAQQKRSYVRTSSAPLQVTRTRSRKPTLRSIRYRDNEIDNQRSRQATLAPFEADDSIYIGATAHSSRKDSILPLVEAEKRRVRNDMASAFTQMSGDARRHYPSGTTRYENRPPVNRATPCKNGPLCRKSQEGLISCPLQLSTISEAHRKQGHVRSTMTFHLPYRQQTDSACSFPCSDSLLLYAKTS
jgi:hypothetical protein